MTLVGHKFRLHLWESILIQITTFAVCITQWEQLILISGCYENHCKNRFGDSYRILRPYLRKVERFSVMAVVCFAFGVVKCVGLIGNHSPKYFCCGIWSFIFVYLSLRGYCTQNWNWVCLCAISNYLHFFMKWYDVSWSKFSEKLRNGIKISVGQVVLELQFKTIFFMFWWISHELLGLLKWQCHFWVSQTICFRMHQLFFKKMLIILR